MRRKIQVVLATEDQFLERAKRKMKFPFLMNLYLSLMESNSSLLKGPLLKFVSKYNERMVRLGLFEKLVEEGQITDGNVRGFYERQKRESEIGETTQNAIKELMDNYAGDNKDDMLEWLNEESDILDCDLFSEDFEWLLKRMDAYECYLERKAS